MTRLLSRRAIGALVAAALVSFTAAPSAQAQQEPILVFAAASLKNALDEIAANWAKKNGVEVRISYAASPALAKQIENAAPADLFISADLDWMDYVAGKNLIKPDTRQSLLSNTLVLIASKDEPGRDIKIMPGFDLAALLGNRRLAMAANATVPAGRYGKAALEKLGIWTSVEKKVAEAENVRAALAFVARGEAPYGIVYRTDAVSEKNVTIAGTFPEGSHPQIVYPLAQLATSKHPRAAEFQRALNTLENRQIWSRHGFSILLSPSGS